MTAVFGTPMAAVLLAVELLLFEWKPRSFIPVHRRRRRVDRLRVPLLLGSGAAVSVSQASCDLPLVADWSLCVGVGIVAGLQSGTADRAALRRGGRVRAAADPLDVVAGDRRPDRRDGRTASIRARSASAMT